MLDFRVRGHNYGEMVKAENKEQEILIGRHGKTFLCQVIYHITEKDGTPRDDLLECIAESNIEWASRTGETQPAWTPIFPENLKTEYTLHTDKERHALNRAPYHTITIATPEEIMNGTQKTKYDQQQWREIFLKIKLSRPLSEVQIRVYTLLAEGLMHVSGFPRYGYNETPSVQKHYTEIMDKIETTIPCHELEW